MTSRSATHARPKVRRRRSIGRVAEPHRTLSERAHPLIEEAAERSRLSAQGRTERLRHAGRAIVQATLAATIAWLVATEVVGHARPFFAPVAAMITLGLTQASAAGAPWRWCSA